MTWVSLDSLVKENMKSEPLAIESGGTGGGLLARLSPTLE